MFDYLLQILSNSEQTNGSDVHFSVGVPAGIRINGEMVFQGSDSLTPAHVRELVHLVLGDQLFTQYEIKGEADCAVSFDNIGRFRVNAFRQKGNAAMVMRRLNSYIPTPESLDLPPSVIEMAKLKNGLVLVTGPTGSGKSTTLAALLGSINSSRAEHIITLEDPIEYVHDHKRSIINQREIGKDTKSYADALRYVLRQDPDVILIGEMRDKDSISVALTAAETGHLVFSTLHTNGAPKTIDRIIDTYQPEQQQQIRAQMSTALKGVVSQRLIPKADGSGRVAVFEVMVMNHAISNLIREGKTHQIGNVIQSGSKEGMISMDKALSDLTRQGIISFDNALDMCVEEEVFRRYAGAVIT